MTGRKGRGRTAADVDLAPLGRGASSRLSFNAAINLLGSVAYYAAVVIVSPIAIGHLGDEAWGIWQLAGAASLYATLVNLGLYSAVSYHVTRAVANRDGDALADAMQNARLFLLGGAALILGWLVVFGRPFVDSLVTTDDFDRMWHTLVVAIVVTAIFLPVRMYLSVLSGLQRYDMLTLYRLVSGCLLLAGVVGGFVFFDLGLLGFAALMSVAPVLPAFFSWVTARFMIPAPIFAWRSIKWPLLREMVFYSLSTVLYTTGTVVLYQSMKLIASWRLGGPAAAGHVGLVVSLAQTLSVIFVPLAGVIHTRVNDLHTRGRSDLLPGILREALAGTGLLAVLISTFIVVEAETVFGAWVGRVVEAETIEVLAHTTRLMMFGQLPYVAFLPCFYALVGIGRHRVFGLGMLAAGVANVALGWALAVPGADISVLGAAFGVVLAALVLFVTVPVSLRVFGLGIWSAVRATLLEPAAFCVPGVIVLHFRPRVGEPILDLVVAGACFGVAVLPGLLWARRDLVRRLMRRGKDEPGEAEG